MTELFYLKKKEGTEFFFFKLTEPWGPVCDNVWGMIIAYSYCLILRAEEEDIGAENKYLRK